MSFREVNELRKIGRLDDALKMAQADFRLQRDHWSASALFWVWKCFCEKYISNSEFEIACKYIRDMESVHPLLNDLDGISQKTLNSLKRKVSPDFDKIERLSELSKNGNEDIAYKDLCVLRNNEQIDSNLHENCGWIIYRYLKRYYSECGSYNARKALFEYIKLNNPRPSLLHSQMLNLAVSVSERYEDFKFLPFLKLWDVNSFSQDDFRESFFDGKTIAPLIERIISRCFSLNYTLNDVIVAFENNNDIDIDIIYNAFSKKNWFEAYNKRESINEFINIVNKYLDSVVGKQLKNESHSKILSQYIRKLPENRIAEFIPAVEKWGMDNFRKEDWKREKKEDTEYPSLVEKTIKVYLNALKSQNCRLSDASNSFEVLLAKAVDVYTDDDQAERYLGLISYSKGNTERALTIYRKLLLKLNRFYVWKELSDITTNRDLKISALCKALLSEPKEEFLGEIHLSLAAMMRDSGLVSNAKKELEIYKNTYEKNGWRLKSAYFDILNSLPSNIPTIDSNTEFYNSHLNIAEEFVFSDIEWITMFISEPYVQKNDDGKEIKTAKLVSSEGKEMSIKQNQLQPSCKRSVGSCFDVKIYKQDDKEKIVLIKSSAKLISDLLTPAIGYIDYYNKDKRIYHIVDENKKQYLLKTNNKLTVGNFCLFYRVPHNTISTSPLTAIFCNNIDFSSAVEKFPENIAVVDHINNEKRIIHFLFCTGEDIMMNFEQTSLKLDVYDFVKIRYIEKEQRVKMEKAHMDSRSLIKKRGVILPNYKTEIIRKVLQIEKLESNIAIQKFPLKIAIVDGINDTKQLFHCVFGQNMDIIIKYSETSLRPKVGDYVKIRYAFQKVEFGQNKRKMLDISSSEQGKLELKKTVSGNIKIVYKDGKYFGFVNDYYVGSQYLYGIEDNDTVKIDVVYNGQKWSAYKLRKIE